MADFRALHTLIFRSLLSHTASAGCCAMVTLWLSPAVGGTLQQCQDASGITVYTDSPAQLDHCGPIQSAPAPIAQQGSSPSSYSTAQPRMIPPSAPSMTSPQSGMEPQFISHEQIPADDLTIATGSPTSPTATPTPAASAVSCHPGLNPLNQFGPPPCQLREEPIATAPEGSPSQEMDRPTHAP